MLISSTARKLHNIKELSCVGRKHWIILQRFTVKWNLNTSIQQIRYIKKGRNTDRQRIRLKCFWSFWWDFTQTWIVPTLIQTQQIPFYVCWVMISYPLHRRLQSSACPDWSLSPWGTFVWWPPAPSAQCGLSPGGRPAGSGFASWETGSCP